MEESRTDETLMLAYRDGDAAAFEVLYARHRGRLFRYLLHQCAQRDQADEIFQEVWMSVIRARSGYEVSARFTTWLFRIAHNRLIDVYRARGRLAEFEIDACDSEGDPPIQQAPVSEQPEQIYERALVAGNMVAAIEALPAPQREAFLLAAEAGLTVEEIGNATGAGYETAKSRLRYAYARLRRELRELR